MLTLRVAMLLSPPPPPLLFLLTSRPQPQGHATLRPGSVRHGGHAVSAGDRYILGAFLLIADSVEYVRRLNNLGRAARGRMDLPKARNK